MLTGRSTWKQEGTRFENRNRKRQRPFFYFLASGGPGDLPTGHFPRCVLRTLRFCVPFSGTCGQRTRKRMSLKFERESRTFALEPTDRQTDTHTHTNRKISQSRRAINNAQATPTDRHGNQVRASASLPSLDLLAPFGWFKRSIRLLFGRWRTKQQARAAQLKARTKAEVARIQLNPTEDLSTRDPQVRARERRGWSPAGYSEVAESFSIKRLFYLFHQSSS